MITINSRSSKPIFEQIVDNVKESILKGAIAPGDKMLSVREMAITLETNPNTVAKAYKELERQKIIETLQGRGTFVIKNYVPVINEDVMKTVQNTLKNLIIETKYMGIKKTEFLQLASKIYDEFGGSSND